MVRIAAAFLVAAGLLVLVFTLYTHSGLVRVRRLQSRPPAPENSEFANPWRFELDWRWKDTYWALGTVDGRVLLVGSGLLIAAGVTLLGRSLAHR
jgi:hypothetical protein